MVLDPTAILSFSFHSLHSIHQFLLSLLFFIHFISMFPLNYCDSLEIAIHKLNTIAVTIYLNFCCKLFRSENNFVCVNLFCLNCAGEKATRSESKIKRRKTQQQYQQHTSYSYSYSVRRNAMSWQRIAFNRQQKLQWDQIW